MMKTLARNNTPAGDSDETAEQQDKFLSRLSTIAYAKDNSVNKSSRASKYKSEFFFHVDEEDEIQIIKDNVYAKEAEDPVNTELILRSEKYATELPAELKDKIERVREFFLLEIAPTAIALQGGLSQAKSIIEQQVGEIDASEMMLAERFAAQSSKIRVMRFIADMFDLTQDEAEKLYDLTLLPKQTQLFMLPQQDAQKQAAHSTQK